MYRHILIPTDGSELAEHAVTNGLSLAKSVGAKVVTVIYRPEAVRLAQRSRKRLVRLHFENLAKHNEQVSQHAARY